MRQYLLRRALAGLALSSLLWGCGGGGGDPAPQTKSYDITLQLDHYKDSCHTIFEFLCLRARQSDAESWSAFFGSVEGFKYELGHRYSLRVRVTEREVPPIPDAPGIQFSYQLLQVLSDTPLPSNTAFTVTLRQTQFSLEQASDGSWSLAGQPMSCSPSLCAALSKAKSSGQVVQLDFDHSSSPQGPLHLLAVRLSGG